MTFDYNHRLVGIGADTQFSYDGRGNRLIATRVGVTTRYIYDPWGNLMAEADSNGITRKYIYGRGLLAMATSSARYCYHFNGIGSTVAITDMTQAVVNSYAYDPFGTVLNQQETIPQPFKFVGQYGVMAEPNGLYYMRARYYDPAVGRFISEDPLGFDGGDVNLYAYVDSVGKPLVGTNLHTSGNSVPQRFLWTNLYAYSDNNPANFIDPYGLRCCWGQGFTGLGQLLAGTATIGSGFALPFLVADATCGVGAMFVVPLSSFMVDVGAWELQHGWENVGNGFFPDDPNCGCPNEN